MLQKPLPNIQESRDWPAQSSNLQNPTRIDPEFQGDWIHALLVARVHGLLEQAARASKPARCRVRDSRLKPPRTINLIETTGETAASGCRAAPPESLG